MSDKTCRRGVKAVRPSTHETAVKVCSRVFRLASPLVPCHEHSCAPAVSHVGGAW